MDVQNMLITQFNDELMNNFIDKSILNPMIVASNGFSENENFNIAGMQDDELITFDNSKSSSQPNYSGVQISFDKLTELKETELRLLLFQWDLEHLAEVCIGIQFFLI